MEENNKERTGILLRCCMCIGGAMGMVSNCMGIYFSPLSKALGVGVGRISIIVTLVSLANAFFAPVFVKLEEKVKLNYLMGSGIVLCMISYVLMSFASSVGMLYLCGLLSGVGMCCFAALPVTMILRDWYGDRNGSAVGAALAFSGVFGAVMNPILSRIISGMSYQMSLRLMALFLGVAVLPCALTLRMKNDGKTEVKTNLPGYEPVSPKVPLPIIVVLYSTCVCYCMLCGMNQHLSALAVSHGYSLEASATVLTAAMIGNIVFKLVYGFASDRINPVYVSVAWSIIGAAGTVMMLVFASSGVLIRAGAVLYGAYFSLSTVALSMLVQMVAKDRYAEVYSRMVIFTSLAYALSVSLYGMSYDILGSYTPALVLIVGITALSVVLALTLNRKTARN